LLSIIAALVCDFGEQYLMQWVGQKAMFDLRRQLMGHLQRLDIAYYDRNPVGRMVSESLPMWMPSTNCSLPAY